MSFDNFIIFKKNLLFWQNKDWKRIFVTSRAFVQFLKLFKDQHAILGSLGPLCNILKIFGIKM